jgi:hypothetical protein
MKQKHPIILVETDKAENAIIIHNVSKQAVYHGNKYFTQEYLKNNNAKAFHLYVLSDDEIKEGDWFIHCNRILKAEKSREKDCVSFNNNSNVARNNCKKIIATTDTDITNDFSTSGVLFVPQIQQSFIEPFITNYNKGNVITEVIVEYEDIIKCEYNYNSKGERIGIPKNKKVGITIKINPDNTIIISSIKDSWDKNEVLEIINLIERRAKGFGATESLTYFVEGLKQSL